MPLNTPFVPPARPVSPAQFANYEQTRKAIDAIQNKAPVADTDFTVHVMEDGTEVCTTERVVKGKAFLPPFLYTLLPIFNSNVVAIDVQAPAFFRPSDKEFFDPSDPTKPNISFLKNHFYREGRLTEEQALYIIRAGTELLRREPNVLEVDAPITGNLCLK